MKFEIENIFNSLYIITKKTHTIITFCFKQEQVTLLLKSLNYSIFFRSFAKSVG